METSIGVSQQLSDGIICVTMAQAAIFPSKSSLHLINLTSVLQRQPGPCRSSTQHSHPTLTPTLLQRLIRRRTLPGRYPRPISISQLTNDKHQNRFRSHPYASSSFKSRLLSASTPSSARGPDLCDEIAGRIPSFAGRVGTPYRWFRLCWVDVCYMYVICTTLIGIILLSWNISNCTDPGRRDETM